MLIRGAELAGEAELDIRLRGARVHQIGRALVREPGEDLLEADGGALLPGLHDHHLHLLALAAAEHSVACGPPQVSSARALGHALQAPAGGADGWIRGVGYHESVAGRLDRIALDRFVPRIALRIQHRSGRLWMLNSAAVERLGLDAGRDAPGVERDARGVASGRLFDLDRWLRELLGPAKAPELAGVGARLARFGITGVTDATPGNAARELQLFCEAVACGALPQRLCVMGRPELPASEDPRVERGPVKLYLVESALPAFETLQADISAAHAAGRSVALHCVTRTELVLAVAALRAAGVREGDRIEHAAVAPPEVLRQIAELGIAVVTQPHFVFERGDAYRREVEPADRPWLIRGRAFLEAGVGLAAGSDAPFGCADPWLAMRAAVERRTAEGHLLSPHEALLPEQALALFLAPAQAAGGAPRRIRPGAEADLCLLDRPWAAARQALSADLVAASFARGKLLYRRG